MRMVVRVPYPGTAYIISMTLIEPRSAVEQNNYA
jgi:hypothetical protein